MQGFGAKATGVSLDNVASKCLNITDHLTHSHVDRFDGVGGVDHFANFGWLDSKKRDHPRPVSPP